MEEFKLEAGIKAVGSNVALRQHVLHGEGFLEKVIVNVAKDALHVARQGRIIDLECVYKNTQFLLNDSLLFDGIHNDTALF